LVISLPVYFLIVIVDRTSGVHYGNFDELILFMDVVLSNNLGVELWLGV